MESTQERGAPRRERTWWLPNTNPDNSRKVAQKRHLKSKNTSAGKHCCQGDIYAKNTPLTDIKANSAGKDSVAWCSWQSCWCKEGRRACAKTADCLLLSLQLHYLCALIAAPKWKMTAADAPTLPKVAYTFVFWTSLLQEKNGANAAAATFSLITANREKQFPKWSGRITNAEKILLCLCLVICCHLSMSWLWYCRFWLLSWLLFSICLLNSVVS